MAFDTPLGVGGLLAVVWALASGCTVNSTTAPATTCSIDGAVACSSGTGYSCTGDQSPQQSNSDLSCGDGSTEADGDVGYCCEAASATPCTIDTTVACTGSTGYTCLSSDSPNAADPSLSCGDGQRDSNGVTRYCCVTDTTSSCAPDSSVTGCSGDSYGFSCSSTDTPSDSNGSLNCSTPVAGDNGASLYCCVGFTSSGSSCSADSSVAGCASGSFGFSCTATDTPDQAQPSLTCSTGVSGTNNELLYCCTNN